MVSGLAAGRQNGLFTKYWAEVCVHYMVFRLFKQLAFLFALNINVINLLKSTEVSIADKQNSFFVGLLNTHSNGLQIASNCSIVVVTVCC